MYTAGQIEASWVRVDLAGEGGGENQEGVKEGKDGKWGKPKPARRVISAEDASFATRLR